MKKFLAIILALVMVFSLAACGSDGGKDKDDDDKDGGSTAIGGIKLVEEKKLSEDLSVIASNGVLGQYIWGETTTTYKFANMDGEFVNSTEYSDYFSNHVYDRYIHVTPVGSRLFGVLDTQTGMEIVPCEAVSSTSLSARYEVFCYSTGEATEETAFGSYWAEDGSTVYYSGYAKIFDYEKGRFVPNITITGDSSLFFGNRTFVFETLNDGRVNAYNSDGAIIGTYYDVEYLSDSNIFLAEDTYIDSFTDPDRFVVVGVDGQIVGTVAQRMSVYSLLSGTDKYIRQNSSAYTTDQEFLTDLNGNVISAGFDVDIVDLIADKYIMTSDYNSETGKYNNGVYNLDGSELITPEWDDIYYYDGYFVTRKGRSYDDSKYTLFDSTGKKISKKEYSGHNGVILYDHDDDENISTVLFLNGSEKKLDYYVGEKIGDLVNVGNSLFDANTGKKLLDDMSLFFYRDGKYYVKTMQQVIVYTAK